MNDSVPLWYKEIKFGRKTAIINTKNLEVLSLGPLFNDTSKTAKIIWFFSSMSMSMRL